MINETTINRLTDFCWNCWTTDVSHGYSKDSKDEVKNIIKNIIREETEEEKIVVTSKRKEKFQMIGMFVLLIFLIGVMFLFLYPV